MLLKYNKATTYVPSKLWKVWRCVESRICCHNCWGEASPSEEVLVSYQSHLAPASPPALSVAMSRKVKPELTKFFLVSFCGGCRWAPTLDGESSHSHLLSAVVHLKSSFSKNTQNGLSFSLSVRQTTSLCHVSGPSPLAWYRTVMVWHTGFWERVFPRGISFSLPLAQGRVKKAHPGIVPKDTRGAGSAKADNPAACCSDSSMWHLWHTRSTKVPPSAK